MFPKARERFKNFCIERLADLIVSDKSNELYRQIMMNLFVCFFLFRVLLPVCLIAGIVLRYNGISIIYLLLLLILPLVPPPTMSSMLSHTGRYQLALAFIAVLIALGQLSFQIVLIATPPYGQFLKKCEDLEILLRHLGFQQYENLDKLNTARLIAPDAVMLVISILIVSICRKLMYNTNIRLEQDMPSSNASRKKKSSVTQTISTFLNLALLAAVGIARPSIANAMYFLVFMATATWIAVFKHLGKSFMYLRFFLLIYSGIHLVLLYTYQLPIMQEIIPPEGIYARLFGLTKLVRVDCEDPRILYFEDKEWATYVNPGLLFLLYWLLAIQIRNWLTTPVEEPPSDLPKPLRDGKIPLPSGTAETWPLSDHYAPITSPPHQRSHHHSLHRKSTRRRRKPTTLKFSDRRPRTERSPLLESGNGHSYETMGQAENALEMDPHGSVIWATAGENEPTPQSPEKEENVITKLRQLIYPLLSIFLLITRQSYIATLIVMMAWSITYHSWLTFILLLWSCAVWMIPNSRSACWRSSPALVAYAEALVVIQYVYGLDLTDSELPQQIEAVNLSQIGLVKERTLPCINLAVKILYTVMFWITLRQYMQERFNAKNKDIAEGVMMQPFNMAFATMQSPRLSRGMSGLTESSQQQEDGEHQTSPFMKNLGDFVKSLLTKYWIWVVALMLLVNGLGGNQVVVFRIVYIALFLFFILMFQLSYRLWRAIMYGFWLTVIIYSMSLLILIYTYQFQNFPLYWEKYIGISRDLQRDIGLEVYDTGGLFINLLRATFFLVITIIQLHYFHKDFLKISDIKYDIQEAEAVTEQRSSPVPEIVSEDQPPAEKSQEVASETKEVEGTKSVVLELGKEIMKRVGYWYGIASLICWRYLEIHICKIVLFSALLLALYDVCAVNIVFIMIVIIATPIRKVQLCFSHFCAVWSAVLLLSKMIYQIEYVNEYWKTNCTEIGNSTLRFPFNETINNAHWMGFRKVTDLSFYLKGYLGLLFVLTLQAVIKVHQRHHRSVNKEPEPEIGIMFPDITRADADNGIIECAKYLANYSFYKFGLEICFITITAGIGVRLDFYAVIYAIWLVTMFLMRRPLIAKLWPFYVIFLTIMIPLQYLLCLGLPPGLCYSYAYDGIMNPELREWFHLPDYVKPPEAYKLTVDFFLLLFACCQLQVFKIESHPDAEEYPGGSNKEIIYIEDYHKTNPIEDFVTYTKTYLDLIKVGIFFSLYWMTLAIFFLAGTNRVSLFAMGYVIGCFLFLWTGQELFLKPILYILKWWNVLISYTISVIFTKSLLQLIGCVFIQDLYANFCWFIQLLGIACLKKFERKSKEVNIPGSDQEECSVPTDEAGLLWDGICLAFLLLQKRFFCSYYFPHLVLEMKAQATLATRGAELINQMLMKEVKEQEIAERAIVEKIKKKMDKIRTHQQKIRGTEYVEPDNHYHASNYSASSTPMYSISLSANSGVNAGRATSAPIPIGTTSSPQPASSPVGPIPSPSSAAYTFSLDSYMEPKLSSGTPRIPSRSQLLPLGSPSEESYPVFSPPPYPALQGMPYTPRSSIVGSLPQVVYHRAYNHRPSITVSPVPSHHTSIRSGDYYLFEEDSDDGLAEFELKDDKSSDEDLKGVRIGRLLSNVLKSDIKQAIKLAESDSEGPPGQDSLQPQSPVASQGSYAATSLGPGSSTRPSTFRSSSPHDVDRLKISEMGSDVPSVSFMESEGILPGHASSKLDLTVEQEKVEGEETTLSRIKNFLKFLKVFIEGIMVSTTSKLNAISRDYRYVARRLHKEKKALKELWLMEEKQLAKSVESDSLSKQKSSDHEMDDTKETIEIHTMKSTDEEPTFESLEMLDTPDILGKEFETDQPVVVRLLIAFWYAVVSRSEIVCYIMIVMNQIKSASILSLPLPLMAFLWGTLSMPRPSKTFWITIITYTEAIVVIKYLFQFNFFPWNRESRGINQPFWAPRILGIEKKEQYALYDLALLLVVFFHRFILKSLGLWKDTSRFDLSPDSTEEKSSSMEKEIVPLSSSSQQSSSSLTLPQKNEPYVLQNDMEDVVVGFLQYIRPFQVFFRNLLNPSYHVTKDVYAFMFICDFITFIIVVFGYWAFGTGGGDGGVTSYFQENKVPIPFLVMLIAQFGLIVIDRALFLRKFILGKLIFQIAMVFVVHLWMFFVLPAVTERQFNSNLPPQMWYFVKCMYLLLSAYQIRSGYPTRVLGNFLTKKYNYLNLILFKCFMAVPFLFELRALMDWIWTDTSMSIGSWLKMEDIFANIFVIKCTRRAEEEYPHPSGEKRSPISKYGVGGILLFILIFIIWFPLVLFALGNTVGIPNPPTSCAIELSFGGYEPIFKMGAQHDDLINFTSTAFDNFLYRYRTKPAAQTFLSNFDYRDVNIARLSGSSTSVWIISPPSQKKLLDELRSQQSKMSLRFAWQFSHAISGTNGEPVVGDEFVKELLPKDPVREELANMIDDPDQSRSVTITNIMPKYIRVPSKGKAFYVKALLPQKELLSNLTLTLQKDMSNVNSPEPKLWWTISEDCQRKNPYSWLPHFDCKILTLVTFNDKTFPSTLSLFSGYGIIGLYTTLVLVASRYVRGMFAGVSFHIMFDDMPCVDRVLQLCLDIYLVRESGELKLEEDLFAKLIFLYRSPETLIKWTRYPQRSHQ